MSTKMLEGEIPPLWKTINRGESETRQQNRQRRSQQLSREEEQILERQRPAETLSTTHASYSKYNYI